MAEEWVCVKAGLKDVEMVGSEVDTMVVAVVDEKVEMLEYEEV